MEGKYQNWSLDNWPEKWDHDDLPEKERREIQWLLCHNSIYEFFQEIPELKPVVPYIFEKQSVVACSFFGTYFVLVIRILSALSHQKATSRSATDLLQRALNFLNRYCALSRNTQEYYGFNEAVECFADDFHIVGEERPHIMKMFSPEVKEVIERTEKAWGIPNQGQGIMKRNQPLIKLIEEIVKKHNPKQ